MAASIGENAFSECKSIATINLPMATSIDYGAFSGCTNLTTIDLPVATEIGNHAFTGCTNLTAVILRSTETVCDIAILAALDSKITTADGTPTGEGFFYVPSALYEAYIETLVLKGAEIGLDAATAEYIARANLRKIEDYPEICG
jgi:hypothetical protein